MSLMTPQQLQQFKVLFQARLETLSIAYDKNQDEIDIDGGDDVDKVQGLMIKNLSDSLVQRDLDAINRLKKALHRIERGVFGLCEECEEPIAVPRLTALPDATTCIACAEDQERLQKQFNLRG